MSSHSARPEETLVDQQEAIRDYLDALLQEIPDFGDDSAVPPEVEVPAGQPEPDVEASEEPMQVSEAEPEAPPFEAVGTGTDAGNDGAMQPREEEASTQDGAPASGHGALQALFFDVGGLRLAVSLTELHSVVPWGDVDVTPMPRQPEWQLGLMRYRGRNVRVVDTVTMVLPPDKRQNPDARAEPQHILVVGDGSWGIACHGIGDVVRLGADEVKWRRRGSARPWLAGTVIGYLSAVIDTGAFASMLRQEGAGY